MRNTSVRLWKTLEPTSDLHRHGSWLELKQRVEEVRDFFQETLAVTSGLAEFSWDMEVGYKGIVQVALPRHMAKTTKKPSLNTEDLDT